jgi:uncharacterized protein (DUF4213/DUF364 family)
MWELYEAMISDIKGNEQVKAIYQSRIWTAAQTETALGMAMTTTGDTRPEMNAGGLEGMSAAEAAKGIKSWNFLYASAAMACINAWYNTKERLDMLGCREPYENYCTRGVELCGKTIGLVGHLKMPEKILKEAKEVFILERNPVSGDYPDSACEYLLPACDVVLITGSSLINKTLPRLLTICRNAYTILTGPTVPMCPALLEFGIDRLAGVVVENPEEMKEYVRTEGSGTPYQYGTSFLLEK